MNQNKNLIIASVTASIFFVVILYLLYLLNLKNTQPTISNPSNKVTGNIVLPSNSPATSITPPVKVPLNWKTYTDTDYGFSFRYPPRFKETNPVQGGVANPEGYSYFSGTSKGDSIHLNVIRFSDTIDDLLQAYQNNRSLFGSTDWGDIGQLDKKTKNNQLDVLWFSSGANISSVMFLGNGLGFLIPFVDNTKGEYDQILSTFKFNENKDIFSKWTTYQSKDGFYSFEYPTNWFVGFDDQNGLRIQNYDPSTASGRGFDPGIDKGKFAFVVNRLSSNRYFKNITELKSFVNKVGETCYYMGDPAGSNVVADENTFTINGYQAYTRSLRCSELAVETKHVAVYLLNQNGQVLVIEKILDVTSEDLTFNKILSTFKFTEPSVVDSQRQTFNGDGFQLQYPKSWNAFPMKKLLLNNCQRVEISKSNAIQLELSPQEYIKQSYGGNINVDEIIKNLDSKYAITFPHLNANNAVVIGPLGEGEINNIFIKGPEGTGYYNIAVTYIGPVPDFNKTCLGTAADEYKQILSTFKFF